jgi:hypothetical protein
MVGPVRCPRAVTATCTLHTHLLYTRARVIRGIVERNTVAVGPRSRKHAPHACHRTTITLRVPNDRNHHTSDHQHDQDEDDDWRCSRCKYTYSVCTRTPSPLLTPVVRVDGEWCLNEFGIDVIADGHDVHFIRFARLCVCQFDMRFGACRFLLHPNCNHV